MTSFPLTTEEYLARVQVLEGYIASATRRRDNLRDQEESGTWRSPMEDRKITVARQGTGREIISLKNKLNALHRKAAKEGLKARIEAIEYSTEAYKAARGREPEGTGIWEFIISGPHGAGIFQCPGISNYTRAKIWALALAEGAGDDRVEVAP